MRPFQAYTLSLYTSFWQVDTKNAPTACWRDNWDALLPTFRAARLLASSGTPSYTSYFTNLHTKQAPHTITALTSTVPFLLFMNISTTTSDLTLKTPSAALCVREQGQVWSRSLEAPHQRKGIQISRQRPGFGSSYAIDMFFEHKARKVPGHLSNISGHKRGDIFSLPSFRCILEDPALYPIFSLTCSRVSKCAGSGGTGGLCTCRLCLEAHVSPSAYEYYVGDFHWVPPENPWPCPIRKPRFYLSYSLFCFVCLVFKNYYFFCHVLCTSSSLQFCEFFFFLFKMSPFLFPSLLFLPLLAITTLQAFIEQSSMFQMLNLNIMRAALIPV